MGASLPCSGFIRVRAIARERPDSRDFPRLPAARAARNWNMRRQIGSSACFAAPAFSRAFTAISNARAAIEHRPRNRRRMSRHLAKPLAESTFLRRKQQTVA